MSKIENSEIIYTAEIAILASMFNSKWAVSTALSELQIDDFSEFQHKSVFEAIQRNVDLGNNVTVDNVYQQLLIDNKIKKIGGLHTLTDITEEYIGTERLEDYINIVLEASRSRQLNTLSKNIIQELSTHKPSEDIIFQIEEEIINLRARHGHKGFVAVKDEITAVINKVEELANSNSDYTGITSGLSSLDHKTLGFQNGDLIILAARPSMGKTALALNFALHIAAKLQKKVAFVSLEMPCEQLTQRLLVAQSRVEANLVRTGKDLTSGDWESLASAGDTLKSAEIFIYDSPANKLHQIQNRLRELVHKEDINVIIVDYLQLLSISDRQYESRQQEMSSISRHLKLLARELNLPIICLSQLSRNVEKRENKRPIMSDLRDSGAIEQDADLVMFLYRDDYYKLNEIDYVVNGKAELILSKHRNGPTGIICLAFSENTGTFEDSYLN